MKRIGSSDSLGGLMSICPTLADDEQIQGNNSHVYSSEFQSMLDDEEPSYVSEKKRRLSVNQVKALEKNFEVENKLEPERKVKLAQELGLQPRQVAVWFQNRRARWKTKQLERDYGLLKANFDALKRNFQNLQHDNQALNTEIQELKSKLQDDYGGIKVSLVSGSFDDREMDQIGSKTESPPLDLDDEDDDNMITECDDEVSTKALNFGNKHNFGLMGTSILADFKDGSSDSDSSALLNSPNATMSSNEKGILQKSSTTSTHKFLISNAFSTSSSSLAMGGLQFSDTKAAVLGDAHKSYLSQFVKIEEHDFFSGEDESCSTFFADDQPPTLPWDCPGEWN